MWKEADTKGQLLHSAADSKEPDGHSAVRGHTAQPPGREKHTHPKQELLFNIIKGRADPAFRVHATVARPRADFFCPLLCSLFFRNVNCCFAIVCLGYHNVLWAYLSEKPQYPGWRCDCLAMPAASKENRVGWGLSHQCRITTDGESGKEMEKKLNTNPIFIFLCNSKVLWGNCFLLDCCDSFIRVESSSKKDFILKTRDVQKTNLKTQAAGTPSSLADTLGSHVTSVTWALLYVSITARATSCGPATDEGVWMNTWHISRF